MPQPTMVDVRPIDPILTNLSIGFKNEKFLWDQIAPISRVDQKSGTFFVYTKDFWFRRQTGGKRGEDGRYTRVGYGVGNDTYTTTERGFEKLLDDATRAASLTPEDLEMVDIQFLTNIMQLELEKDVADELFVTGKWGTSNVLTGGDQWSDYGSSDPIADVDLAKQVIRRNTGVDPTDMFIGRSAWIKLKENPLILDKYKYTQVGVMTPELVAAVLGIGKLTIGDSIENTAEEGASFVGADIWTDNVLFTVKNSPGLGVTAGAFTLMWPEGGSIPWSVQSYRSDPQRGQVSRVFGHYIPKIVASEAGYLFLDVVA